MTSHDHNETGHEHLSALFDGELGSDAAQFALKRLGQDARWRDTCGTWQLAGDVLRGQAMAAAPGDFADRVQVALAAGRTAEPALTTVARRRAPQRWIGGAAFAASVAAAALFIARPAQDSIPGQPVPLVATASGSATPSATSPDAASAAGPARKIDTAVAVAQVPAAQTRSMRDASSPARRPVRAPDSVEPPASVAGQMPLIASGEAADISTTMRPFEQAADRIAVRPWPRAALSSYPASGALTAGFAPRLRNSANMAEDASPSFYPFEPRLPPADSNAVQQQP